MKFNFGKFSKKYIKPFFFRKDFPNSIVAPYVYSFFLFLIFLISCSVKIWGSIKGDDLPLDVIITLIGGMMLSLIALYNIGKSK